MRIGIISRYPPQKCGISFYTENFVDAFIKLGNEVEVIAFKGYKYKDKKVVPLLEKDSLLSYFRAANYISKKGFDRIMIEHEYLNYNPLFFPVFLLCLKLKGQKINLVQHSVAKYGDLIKRNLFRLWNTSFLVFTDQVYLHTEKAARLVKKESLILPKKITLLRIPIKRIKGSSPRLSKGRTKNLLAQGFIAEDKGYHLIIDAFGGIRDYKVQIVGTVNESLMKKEHHYLDRLKRSAERYGNIKIVDRFITEKEKEDVTKWADFIILPYIRMEQSANLTTAWGANRIPVCSDLAPFKEEIKNNRYGILFKSGDSRDLRLKVMKVKDDMKEQKRIVDNIKNLVRKRDFTEMAKRFINTLV